MSSVAAVRTASVVVGRDAEVHSLLGAVHRARAGGSSCVLLVGEGGVGKSRLLAEARTAASRLRLTLGSAQAPITTPAPFAVVSEALRSCIRGSREPALALRSTGTPFDHGLRLVLPEWSVAQTAASDLSSAQIRLLALEGVVVLLRRLAADGDGLLVLLDDLHGADPDSLEAIRYVCTAAIEGLTLVGALRPGEFGPADELVRAARALPPESTAVVELDPLDRTAVSQLVANLLDTQAPPELVADVIARTDGVPLLVEEVVAAHMRAGSLRLEAGEARWRPGSVVVPRSVSGLVAGRLERIPEKMRDVLLAGAVLGDFEPAPLVAAVAGLDGEGVVLDALRRGVDAGLLATKAGHIGFRHDILRQAMIASALPQVLRAFHLRAAQALAAASASPARRAEHLAAGGQDDDAAALFATAALEELAGHGLLEADQLARRGAELATSREARSEASNALATVLAAEGRWTEALAIDRATVAENGHTPARRCRMALAALESGSPEVAAELLDDVTLRSDPAARVLASRVAIVRGEAGAALADIDEVLADDTIDLDTRLAALDLRGRALDFLGDRLEAAAAWSRQAIEAAAAGKTQSELRAIFMLAKQEFFDGGPPGRLREAAELARREGAFLELAIVEETLAIALTLHGDPRAALEVLGPAIERAREMRLDQLVYLLIARAGAQSLVEPSLDGLFDEVEAMADAPDVRLQLIGMQSDLVMHRGDIEDGLALLQEADRLAAAMPGTAPFDAHCRTVWALAALGRTSEAEAELGVAEAIPDLARWYMRPVQVAAARALLAGDAEGVDAAFAGARGPMPLAIALMRVIAAQVLGGERSGAWLLEAFESYERMGAVAPRDHVRRLLRDAGIPITRRRRATSVPHDLAGRGVTAREAEVLGLLGAGRSNAEIAEELVLSVRTVETHVSSLLGKLQAKSRGQLIALVARLGDTQATERVT